MGQKLLQVPQELQRFATPALMAGERVEDYEILRQLLIEDVAPQSTIEWLWLFDLTELSWEILRYRKLKARALEMYRVRAIEALLYQLDGAGIPGDREKVRRLTKRNAADWQSDLSAADEIESRLEQVGFDLVAINAEIFVQAREIIALFDTLLHSAQRRRDMLIREIKASRSFGLSFPRELGSKRVSADLTYPR